MKIPHLVCVTLLLGATSTLAQAQTTAGTLLLSGNINYYSNEATVELAAPNPNQLPRSETKFQQFTFNPVVGYFVADNLAIGLSAGVQTGKSSAIQTSYSGFGNPQTLETYTNSERTKSLSVGPFVRYYKMVGDKAGFYGQLAGGYQHSSRKQQNDYYAPSNGFITYDTNGGYASILPGFVFFPTPKFGLELTLGSLSYSRFKSKPKELPTGVTGSESTSSGFAANFGLQNVTLGASFHLGK